MNLRFLILCIGFQSSLSYSIPLAYRLLIRDIAPVDYSAITNVQNNVNLYGGATGSNAGFSAGGTFNTPPTGGPATSISSSFGTINNGVITTGSGTTTSSNTIGSSGTVGGQSNFNSGGQFSSTSPNQSSYGINSSQGTSLNNGLGMAGSMSGGIEFIRQPDGSVSTSASYSSTNGVVSPIFSSVTSNNAGIANGNAVTGASSNFNVQQPTIPSTNVSTPVIPNTNVSTAPK
ncbi:hypothetical protein K502DRAFT_344399 [Neoconidiobolus thromboides FSU 785]|nr:hypothetical protein K502DRAFT_344399 [Neoconidiobolus thromboides FSU 785]